MANHSEIIDEIEALALHCRAPLMSVDQRSRWAQDWAQDLAKFEIDAIRDAFRDWRHGDNGKFPTAGQILPLIRAKTRNPEQEARDHLRLWSYDMGDRDYATLSLSEKIRHHKISASHCRQMAGPMPFERGKLVKQEDMPESWKAWRHRAERHDEQVQKLRKTLTECEARA